MSYGYVADNLDGVKYFEDCLTWNIDGSTGIVFYREGRFSLSEKVLPLIISKNYGETLLPEYLKIVLEIESKKKGFSRSNKAGKTKIQNILLPIPVKEDDTIDLEIQEEIIKKYKYVNKVKKKLLTELTELINTKVEVE